MKRYFILLFLFLTACSSISTPDSHYYRLKEIDISSLSKQSLKIPISLESVKVTGLLNNRNLMYVELSHPQEVIQFHYHLWHESLPHLLSKHFTSYVKEARQHKKSNTLKDSVDNKLIARLHINNMEIQYLSNETLLYVNMNVVIMDKSGSIILDKVYSSVRKYQSKEIYQLVTNYNEVLLDVYSEILKDISLL